MKIGILGGTFDPIHIGHLIIAEQARDQFSLDKVLLIPSGHSYFKDNRAQKVQPALVRYEMTVLAAADNALVQPDIFLVFCTVPAGREGNPAVLTADFDGIVRHGPLGIQGNHSFVFRGESGYGLQIPVRDTGAVLFRVPPCKRAAGIREGAFRKIEDLIEQMGLIRHRFIRGGFRMVGEEANGIGHGFKLRGDCDRAGRHGKGPGIAGSVEFKRFR